MPVKNKSLLALVALIVILCAIIVFLKFKPNTQSLQAREFDGRIISFGTNSFVMQGSFLISDRNNQASEAVKEVTVNIQTDTKINKVIVYTPSLEEVKQTDGGYDPGKLKQEETQVDFNMLKKDLEFNKIDIQVKTNENIYGKNTINASEIRYSLSVRQ